MTFPDKSGMSLSGVQFFAMRNDLNRLTLDGRIEIAESTSDVDIERGDDEGGTNTNFGWDLWCEMGHFLSRFVLEILACSPLMVLWMHYHRFNTSSFSILEPRPVHRTARLLAFGINKDLREVWISTVKGIGQFFKFHAWRMIRMRYATWLQRRCVH